MVELEFFDLGKKEEDMSVKERAEQEIFNLRKKQEECLRVGDTVEFQRIAITIGELQKSNHAFYGVDRKQHERTAG